MKTRFKWGEVGEDGWPLVSEDKFWSRVHPEPTSGCWLWVGALDKDGYGQFTPAPRRCVRAHRFSYELSVGEIPAGLTLDHKCRTRCCVNPDHLEPVTVRENNARGLGVTATNLRKTHCPHGHEYTPENTLHNRGRVCRTCNRARINRLNHARRGLPKRLRAQ